MQALPYVVVRREGVAKVYEVRGLIWPLCGTPDAYTQVLLVRLRKVCSGADSQTHLLSGCPGCAAFHTLILCRTI